MQIARWILKVLGWKVINNFPQEVKKAVVIAAPHTSNWDFIMGFLAYKAIGIHARYLMKKEAFFFPIAYFLKRMGAIPVDRRPGNHVVDDIVEEINSAQRFVLTITPEGTRSKVGQWKDGFYRICNRAQIPLYLAKIDFDKKELGVLQQFEISGDFEEDIKKIKAHYKAEMARHPELF